MDLLKRDLAPIVPEAWEQIDEEARRVLEMHLAGRKLVDFSGPHGWKCAAVNTGRLEIIDRGLVPDVPTAVRQAQPLVEVRAPFELALMELDVAGRGANDLDLDPVIDAAKRVARAEDSAIFHGWKPAHITGMIEASPHAPVVVSSALEWPRAVVHAKEVLRVAGATGPYALVLGASSYDELSFETEDGYPLRRRIEGTVIDGPIVWAPALRGGAVLLSTRGGDFELTVGQDLSIGYASHDRDNVDLYITESFTFRVLEEKAAIFLKRPSAEPRSTSRAKK
jgi:uncharacterized linocin/CFP29 family protein